MVSVPDLGWGSVVGNTLENGATYLPTGADMAAAVRDGGRAAERRAAPHRHGRDARKPGLARLQAKPRPLARHALHAVELRDRHEDGRVADADAGVLHAALAPRLERRRPARVVETLRMLMLERTIENVPQIWNTIALRVGALLSIALVRGREPIPDVAHRRDGARARGRPLDDALRPLRRRGGRRPPLPQGQGGVRADPGRRGVGREARAGGVRRGSRTRTSGSRPASRTSTSTR